MAQHVHVGGEQRETLVDDAARGADGTNRAIPAEAGVAAVLHERRRLAAGREHLLEMPQRDVADAEEPRASGVALLGHRRPYLGVLLAPAMARRRAVQHVAVHGIGAQVLER